MGAKVPHPLHFSKSTREGCKGRGEAKVTHCPQGSHKHRTFQERHPLCHALGSTPQRGTLWTSQVLSVLELLTLSTANPCKSSPSPWLISSLSLRLHYSYLGLPLFFFHLVSLSAFLFSQTQPGLLLSLCPAHQACPQSTWSMLVPLQPSYHHLLPQPHW